MLEGAPGFRAGSRTAQENLARRFYDPDRAPSTDTSRPDRVDHRRRRGSVALVHRVPGVRSGRRVDARPCSHRGPRSSRGPHMSLYVASGRGGRAAPVGCPSWRARRREQRQRSGQRCGLARARAPSRVRWTGDRSGVAGLGSSVSRVLLGSRTGTEPPRPLRCSRAGLSRLHSALRCGRCGSRCGASLRAAFGALKSIEAWESRPTRSVLAGVVASTRSAVGGLGRHSNNPPFVLPLRYQPSVLT